MPDFQAEHDAAFKVVIPARYGSSRLPGKPLLEIDGKPMIQHVCEQARQSGAEEVVVATDDARILEKVNSFGCEVLMTSSDHQSGTDRIAEVVEKLGWSADTIVVNLQGDEPVMPPALIHQVARDMADHELADVTTLSVPISEKSQIFDPNVVKIVIDHQGFALYFSRAPIPWHRDEFSRNDWSMSKDAGFLRHIGLYAYRAGFLKHFSTLPPSPIEQAELLEQLRVLWQGGRIHVSSAIENPGQGIDTLDDLNRLREHFSRHD